MGLRTTVFLAGVLIAGCFTRVEAAVYDIIFSQNTGPQIRGVVDVPDSRLGPSHASELVPWSSLNSFSVEIDGVTFRMPGDKPGTPSGGLQLDGGGQPIGFASNVVWADIYDVETREQAYLLFSTQDYINGNNRWWYHNPYNSIAKQQGTLRFISHDAWPENIFVVTHGMIPDGNFKKPFTLAHITKAIWARLDSEGIARSKTHIIEFRWPEAVINNTIEYSIPFNKTSKVAELLSLQLKTFVDRGSRLTEGRYDPKIHFIGHSLGAMVNAAAARNLARYINPIIIDQFTILDDPYGVGYNDPATDPCNPVCHQIFFYGAIISRLFISDTDYFYRLLSVDNVLYVENFYATQFKPPAWRWGGPLPGAGPLDTFRRKKIFQGAGIPNTDHVTIHTKFYEALIRTGITVPTKPPRRFEWVSPALPGWKPLKEWEPEIARYEIPYIGGPR